MRSDQEQIPMSPDFFAKKPHIKSPMQATRCNDRQKSLKRKKIHTAISLHIAESKDPPFRYAWPYRSEEHTSELHHVAISYAVFCLKKKTEINHKSTHR